MTKTFRTQDDVEIVTSPHFSLKDYNRTMLEYTRRQVSALWYLENESGRSSTSSVSGQKSRGNSDKCGRSRATANETMASQTAL